MKHNYYGECAGLNDLNFIYIEVLWKEASITNQEWVLTNKVTNHLLIRNRLSPILPLVEHWKMNQTPTQCSTKHMPSWWRSRWKFSLDKALVKISANWSWEEMKKGRRRLARKASRMMWYWTSICLVRRWNSGFLMRRRALWLLVNSGVGEVGALPRLVSKRRCQIISLVAEEAAKYSASVVLLAQLACMWEAQKTGPWLTKRMYSERDFRSSRSMAKSTSL